MTALERLRSTETSHDAWKRGKSSRPNQATSPGFLKDSGLFPVGAHTALDTGMTMFKRFAGALMIAIGIAYAINEGSVLAALWGLADDAVIGVIYLVKRFVF